MQFYIFVEVFFLRQIFNLLEIKCLATCFYLQNASHVTSSCINTETLSMRRTELSATELGLSATKNILPYNSYTIIVVAVNEVGKGHPATVTETTLEEGS